MDSALSAAFEPIAFLQRLHEGFLLLQSFCFIYFPSPPACQLGAGLVLGVPWAPVGGGDLGTVP